MGGPVIVAIANQDEVFYVQDRPDALAALKHTLIQEGYDSTENMLSASLYQLDGDGWWRASNVQLDSIPG